MFTVAFYVGKNLSSFAHSEQCIPSDSTAAAAGVGCNAQESSGGANPASFARVIRGLSGGVA